MTAPGSSWAVAEAAERLAARLVARLLVVAADEPLVRPRRVEDLVELRLAHDVPARMPLVEELDRAVQRGPVDERVVRRHRDAEHVRVLVFARAGQVVVDLVEAQRQRLGDRPARRIRHGDRRRRRRPAARPGSGPRHRRRACPRSTAGRAPRARTARRAARGRRRSPRHATGSARRAPASSRRRTGAAPRPARAPAWPARRDRDRPAGPAGRRGRSTGSGPRRGPAGRRPGTRGPWPCGP